MWPSEYDINVSRETAERLELYHALLLKWQKAINLVSPSTINEAWIRHFADSAQIEPLIPSGTKIYADLGCGGGFPGMVVAMMRPELEVHLVESDERKCQFLRTVSRESGVKVSVHPVRIEAAELAAPDVISARALADLSTLLGYIEPWSGKDGFKAIFMKGERWHEEIEAAQQQFAFEYEARPSVTDPRAHIIELGKIHRL